MKVIIMNTVIKIYTDAIKQINKFLEEEIKRKRKELTK